MPESPSNVVEPAPAASVVLLRDTACGPEILYLRRSPDLKFMGGSKMLNNAALVHCTAEGELRQSANEVADQVLGSGDGVDEASPLLPPPPPHPAMAMAIARLAILNVPFMCDISNHPD
mgnify:CR=1 FL=1